MSKVSVQMEEHPLSPAGADRRRSERSQLTVRVDYTTVDEVFSEFTRDINEGGLFIETEKPPPTGTEVSMYFSLPGSEEAVHTIGRVVRINAGEDGEPPGMGIEFDDLTGESRNHINDLIRGLRAGPAPSEGEF
jgi:uncharacterized protein (TIGR02266 family)